MCAVVWADSGSPPEAERATHFSRVSQSHRMVRATRHFCHLPVEQVSRDEHRSHSLVGRSISQLAVAIMSPGKQLSV